MNNRIPITLYEHDSTSRAPLLSRDGSRPQWIPQSLVTSPQGTKLVKVKGQSLAQGTYEIERWKAEELGWGEADHPDQIGMNLLGET